MRILAVDTSSKAASCAVWQDGILKGEYLVNAGFTHSQTIMPMVEALLRDTGMALEEMDRFGVSNGPGSFTGLRIGLSAVKGMAMAWDKPCVAVSTLEGLARNISCFDGYLVPVMDARVQQVYTGLFRCQGGQVCRAEEDQAIPITELGEKLARLDSRAVMLVGDGAVLCHNALKEQLPWLRLCPEGLMHQRAGSIAAVAAEAEETISAEALEPSYLRLPQAQRELMKKQKEKQA